MKLRTKNTTLTALLCMALTFFASLMLLSEWHYNENRLSPLGFKLLSIVVITTYLISYSNLALNIFDGQKIEKRVTTENIFLIVYFIGQSVFTLVIFLGLLLVTLGFW